MNVSALSAASASHDSSPAQAAGEAAAAVAATQTKDLQIQDEIILSVIEQVQDQQQVMAEGLIGMMQGTIDLLA